MLPDNDEMGVLDEKFKNLSSEVVVIRAATAKNSLDIQAIQGDLKYNLPILQELDEILKGRGKEIPSLVDDVRTVKEFVGGVKFWLRTIAVMLIAQFVAIGFSAVFFILRVWPMLQAQIGK